MAVGHAALDDAQRAAIRQGLHHGGIGGPVGRHALGHPFLGPAIRARMVSALGVRAHQVFEASARNDEVGNARVDLPVPVVAQDQPVFGVEQHKGFVDGFDGAVQRSLRARGFGGGLLACRDVGTDFHEAVQRACSVMHGLHLGVDPVLASILGAVEHLHAATHPRSRRVQQRLQG